MTHPCHNCTHHEGRVYVSDTGERRPPLCCSMHPYGPDGVSCEDWEKGVGSHRDLTIDFSVSLDLTGFNEAMARLLEHTEAADRACEALGVAIPKTAQSFEQFVEELGRRQEQLDRELAEERVRLAGQGHTAKEIAEMLDELCPSPSRQPNFRERVWADVVRME